MSVARRLLPPLVAALSSGCSVEVELEGKRCPCASGYLCDESTQICVAELCAVSAKSFAPLWSTPHSLAFAWTPTGAESKFLSYEIVVAASEADLGARSGSARTLTSAEHPELSTFATGDGGPNVVLVGGLTPDSIYYAQLVATDTDRCASRSSVVAGRTSPAPTNDPIVLFDAWAPGDPPPSISPEFATLSGTGPEAEILYVLANDTQCFGADARSECGQPIKLELTVGVVAADDGQANRVRPGTFGDAYLELTLWYASPVAAKWGVVWLHPEGAASDYRFDGWTVPASEGWSTIEVPLHALEGPTGPLQHRDLTAAALQQLGLGAQWHRDGVVHIDAVRIWH